MYWVNSKLIAIYPFQMYLSIKTEALLLYKMFETIQVVMTDNILKTVVKTTLNNISNDGWSKSTTIK